ncbi:MAG: hypothetical protein RMJ43_07920 [Chloroherpetonaceae bacterium]|nr:hypothetical protein [Chthonomonadaceae bacterium]MDW8207749.1 hypothetical protein [Chloroherpetonaceae bacterium]
MYRKHRLTTMIAVAGLLTGWNTVRVEAQFVPPGPQISPQGPNRGPGGRFPGRMSPAPFNNQMASNAMAVFSPERMRRLYSTDPTRSAINYLLTRNDVRSELGISTRQREALNEMNQKAPMEMFDRMRNSAAMQQIMQKIRQMGELSPEERRAQREQIRQEFQLRGQEMFAEVQNFQSDLDKRAEAILTPAQVRRLRELDLQYRGGLALADPAIAQEMELSPEQTEQINRLAEEFRRKQLEIIAEAMGARAFTGTPQGNNQNVAPPLRQGQVPSQGQGPVAGNGNGEGQGKPLEGSPRDSALLPSFNATVLPQLTAMLQNPQQMQARLDQAQAEIDKLRKKYGARALALLDQPQTLYWKKLTGRPFTFRVVD